MDLPFVASSQHFKFQFLPPLRSVEHWPRRSWPFLKKKVFALPYVFFCNGQNEMMHLSCVLFWECIFLFTAQTTFAKNKVVESFQVDGKLPELGREVVITHHFNQENQVMWLATWYQVQNQVRHIGPNKGLKMMKRSVVVSKVSEKVFSLMNFCGSPTSLWASLSCALLRSQDSSWTDRLVTGRRS